MKLFFATILLISTTAYGADLNVPKLPLPLNTVDTFDFTLTLIEHTYDDVVEYAKAIQPQKIDIQPIVITRYDDIIKYIGQIKPETILVIKYIFDNYDSVLRYAQAINPDIISITRIEVNNYGEVVAYGQELSGAIKSVRISHYLQSKDYVKLQAELKGVMPDERVEALVGYMQGTVKPAPEPDSTFRIYGGWYDVITGVNLVKINNTWQFVNGKPNIDDNIFVTINDLPQGWERKYDKFFSTHKGRIMIVWNWMIDREGWIRQSIPDFIGRYPQQLDYILGGDPFNPYDLNPPYDVMATTTLGDLIPLILSQNPKARIWLCETYWPCDNAKAWRQAFKSAGVWDKIYGIMEWGLHGAQSNSLEFFMTLYNQEPETKNKPVFLMNILDRSPEVLQRIKGLKYTGVRYGG